MQPHAARSGWLGWTSALHRASKCPPTRVCPHSGDCSGCWCPLHSPVGDQMLPKQVAEHPPIPTASPLQVDPTAWPHSLDAACRRQGSATMPAARALRPACLPLVVLALAVGANAIMPNCSLTVDYA
jgi:hypothetical protein